MGSPVWGMPTSYSSTLQLTLTLFRGNLASQDSRGIRKGSELNRDCFCQLCSHPKLGFSSDKIEPVVGGGGKPVWLKEKKNFGSRQFSGAASNHLNGSSEVRFSSNVSSPMRKEYKILQSIVNSAPVVFSHSSPLWIWIGNTFIHFDSRSNFSICLPVEKWHLHLKLLTASRSHDIKGGGNAKEIKIAQKFRKIPVSPLNC